MISWVRRGNGGPKGRNAAFLKLENVCIGRVLAVVVVSQLTGAPPNMAQNALALALALAMAMAMACPLILKASASRTVMSWNRNWDAPHATRNIL